MAKRKPSALTLGRLMNCYDTCTKACLDRIVGQDDDTTICGDNTRFGFLQHYRNEAKDVPVYRIYLLCAGHFSIKDSEAIEQLRLENLAFIPLIVPGSNKRHLLPTAVTDRIYVSVYGQVLYTLWDHLRDHLETDDLTSAALISFQNVPELAFIRKVFESRCHELTHITTKQQLLAPIKQELIDRFNKRNELVRIQDNV